MNSIDQRTVARRAVASRSAGELSVRGTWQKGLRRLTVQRDWDILWNVQINAWGEEKLNSSSSPGPVTHLAALETCTRIPTEFCKTSSTTRYFHTDFIAHEKPFIIFGDTFLGRFATLEFLERMRFLKRP
jgi:hypothetical protein